MKRVILESPLGKECSKCRNVRPSDSFCRDKNRKDGRHPQCRECVCAYRKELRTRPEFRKKARAYGAEWARRPKNRAKNLAYQKTERGRDVKLAAKRKAKYGITRVEFSALLSAHGGVCAVCRAEFPSTKQQHIDHCHATGKVRGVICGNCNRALGAVQDSEETLQVLIEYLRRSRCAE